MLQESAAEKKGDLQYMYQRLSSVLFPIVTIALIGTGMWGYQEHQDKNSILIKAENQYQRAFYDLTYYMDQLNSELGKARAVNGDSEQYQKRKLIQVWRITSEAHNQINQLPLTLLPFNKTEEFLDKIANFTYQASLRDLTKDPLTEKEKSTLKALHERSKELSNELRSIQSKAMKQNVRWMDVEMALASEHKNMDNAIIDGFKTVDNKVSEYSEVEWGESVQSLYEKRSAKMLTGKPKSESEIKQTALKFLGGGNVNDVQVVENGKGTEYASYSVLASREDGRTVQMDYSKNGHLLWFSNTRDVEDSRLSPEQATSYARKFLDQQHYGPLVPVNYDEYENVGNITFAAVDHDVVCYIRKITVKVALDNAEILGLQATDYVYEAASKPPLNSKLTIEQAAKRLNPDFQILSKSKAYIKNEMSGKVLCYQFTGQVNGEYYRIFIHADTGEEEQVETIQPIEAAYKNLKR